MPSAELGAESIAMGKKPDMVPPLLKLTVQWGSCQRERLEHEEDRSLHRVVLERPFFILKFPTQENFYYTKTIQR